MKEDIMREELPDEEVSVEGAQEAPVEEAEPETAAPLEAQSLSLEEERRELERQRAVFEREKLENTVFHELEKRGIPGSFSEFLTAEDEAASLERVERFTVAFREGIVQEVSKRMRGTAPRDPVKPAGLTLSQLREMTPAQINAHWDEVTRALRN